MLIQMHYSSILLRILSDCSLRCFSVNPFYYPQKFSLLLGACFCIALAPTVSILILMAGFLPPSVYSSIGVLSLLKAVIKVFLSGGRLPS